MPAKTKTKTIETRLERLQRLADEQEFRLSKSYSRGERDRSFDGYMLFDTYTWSIVLGARHTAGSATLDQVEVYLADRLARGLVRPPPTFTREETRDKMGLYFWVGERYVVVHAMGWNVLNCALGRQVSLKGDALRVLLTEPFDPTDEATLDKLWESHARYSEPCSPEEREQLFGFAWINEPKGRRQCQSTVF